MCSGSEPDQMNLIPVSFTLMETVVLNVRRVSRLDLHRNVSTASLRTSAPLMPGLITALWPHVERFCLEMEQNWTLEVSLFCCLENSNIQVSNYTKKSNKLHQGQLLIIFSCSLFFPFNNVSGPSTWSPTADALIYLLCATLAIGLVFIAFLLHCYNSNRSYSQCYSSGYN